MLRSNSTGDWPQLRRPHHHSRSGRSTSGQRKLVGPVDRVVLEQLVQLALELALPSWVLELGKKLELPWVLGLGMRLVMDRQLVVGKQWVLGRQLVVGKLLVGALGTGPHLQTGHQPGTHCNHQHLFVSENISNH